MTGSYTATEDNYWDEPGESHGTTTWAVNVALGETNVYYHWREAYDFIATSATEPTEEQHTLSESTLNADFGLPYSAGDLNGECDGLLARWNLLDDIEYPWRSDGDVNQGPLVTYNERGATAPKILAPGDQDTSLRPWPSQPEEAILGAPLPVHGPGGQTYVNEPYFNFYHINWTFVDTGRGFPEPVVESHGASSPYPNATQWTDKAHARVLPAGPFCAYGSEQGTPGMFWLKDPYLTDTTGEYEQGGLGAGCLIKCKWAETLNAPAPPGNDFVFKDWTFNFRDFFESYSWNVAAWMRDNYDTSCPSLAGCTPERYTPLVIPPDNPAAGYYIDPSRGSYWISGMNCTPKNYVYDCCRPAVYVQPGSDGLDCSNGLIITMPPATCDGKYGSLWMGRVDQSTANGNACDNYVANRNNGVANPPSCDPQIELDLLWHERDHAYEAFVQSLPLSWGGTPAPLARLAVHAKRDGKITFDAPDLTAAAQPYRFWVNDDHSWVDEIGSGLDDFPGDYPGSPMQDSQIVRVGGLRDLIDYFPVALDIKGLLAAFPPSASVTYRLTHADNCLNFIYTALTCDNAGSYRSDLNTAQALAFLIKNSISGDGVDLNPTWLNRLKDTGQNVILVEASHPTTQPLVLSVFNNGKTIAQARLYLSIQTVENMYRSLNLRDGPDAPSGLAGDLSQRDSDPDRATCVIGAPPNLPDELSDGRWFVFVVGSNVGGKEMRAWQSQVFRRLYWSGSNSKFIGVSWFGDPHSGDMFYDYHAAVRNAFTTATPLAQWISALSGAKTIAGHSLGCGLIAFAISDHGLSVKHACFLDAALAAECFDGDLAEDLYDMAHPAWMTVDDPPQIYYPRRYWASDWYKLFLGTPDARKALTWKNRFGNELLSVLDNFYSTTEDVLAPWPGLPNSAMLESFRDSGFAGAYAWIVQEKAKGNAISIPWVLAAGSYYGGWGFNIKDPLLATDPVYWEWVGEDTSDPHRAIQSPDQIGTVSSDVLSRHPVFEPGWGVVGGANRDPNTDPANFTGPSWIWTVKRSCSDVQIKGVTIAAAGRADF